MPHSPPHQLQRSAPQRQRSRGFSLIELISVIIIVGVLAAIAVPRYIALGRDARLAALQAMTGTLWSAANNVHMMCGLTPTCDYGSNFQALVIAGQNAWVNYGWPEAGEIIGNSEIDTWVTYAGFTVSLPNSSQTKFSLDGAPDPTNCAAIYQQAYLSPGNTPVITSLTGGC